MSPADLSPPNSGAGCAAVSTAYIAGSHTPRLPLLEKTFSFSNLLALLSLAFASIFLPHTIEDPDIWWHLRNAQLQLHTRSFLTSDTYSFTARGAEWINHEWLAEIPFYLGWRIAGAQGVLAITALLLAMIFIGVFYLALRHSKSPPVAFLCTLVSVFLSTVSFGPRTLLCGWLCLIIELLLFDHLLSLEAPHAERIVWAFPLLFGLWVNLHGSWLIGFVLLVVFAAAGCIRCEAGALHNPILSKPLRKSLLLSTAASFGALFLNPYTYRLVLYPFDLAYRQKLNIASVEEWATLDFHTMRAHCLFLVLALFVGSLLFRRRNCALYELAFLFIGVYAAFTYSRFLFLAAILVLPILAKDFALWSTPRRAPDRPLLNAGIMVSVLLLAAAWQRTPMPAGVPSYPDRALPYLRALEPHGHVMNDYLWGGYLAWHTPDTPVFIDSRVDIFERNGVFRDYLDATRMVNTLAILDKYKIDYVLFRADAPIIYLLEHTQGWRTDYRDPSTVLLERMPVGAR